MKVLIATLLLGALGAGTLHFTNAAATGAKPAAPCPHGCEATVTCTPEGHCLVTCHRPDGSTCSIEIACDGDECRIVGCSGTPECSQSCTAPCR